MRLTLEWLDVRGMRAGPSTRLDGSLLQVNLEELRALLEADHRLERVRVDLAHPGDSCRIGRVLDVMAPRAKLDGGEDFPGLLGALARAGSGRTRALAGVAVVVTDQQPENAAALALIDMSGPGAALSEFARTENLVVSGWPAAGTGGSEYLAAMRLAGLKAAVYLARADGDRAPDRLEVFDLPAPTRVPVAVQHLPRVAYVFQIHSHQRPTGIDEGILYGDPVRRMLPTVVHPNEVLDGAVVRGFMGRNATTYAIQNHPVIRALYAEHGRTLCFVGVVLTVAQATEPERVRSATLAAGLVTEVLGADGAVFTKMGGGAPHVDIAQAAAQCEAQGVKTTLIVEDMSTDGSSEGMLLFNNAGLDALVNVGCSREALTLPAVSRVLGADDLAPAFQDALSTSYTSLCGAIEQVGASRVVAVVQ
ncbi:MAG TPA: glycine/sarcosine/betaine reductase component B subunit [Methylomirabilota bacterium]|nr:glycine/sarcosine/betaine reductase component B subunit [Methylomirabilota bacterium]